MADYYDDSSDRPMPDKKKGGDEGESTALLPLDFFPHEPEVGKVCKVRVEKIYEGQASVTYVADKDKDKEKKEKNSEDEDEIVEETSDVDELMA
jgi:hypothetical protein